MGHSRVYSGRSGSPPPVTNFPPLSYLIASWPPLPPFPLYSHQNEVLALGKKIKGKAWQDFVLSAVLKFARGTAPDLRPLSRLRG